EQVTICFGQVDSPNQVVVNVSEIGVEVVSHDSAFATNDSVYDLAHGSGGAAELDQLALEDKDTAQHRRVGSLQDLGFDLAGLFGNVVENRHVGVHQLIEQVIKELIETLDLILPGSIAQPIKKWNFALADRDEKIAPDERVEVVESHLLVVMKMFEDEEEISFVFFQLRALRTMTAVFDLQWVQLEFRR